MHPPCSQDPCLLQGTVTMRAFPFGFSVWGPANKLITVS